MHKRAVDAEIVDNFKGSHILSLDQFTPKSLELLFKETNSLIGKLKKNQELKGLAGKIITLLFFEPSSRTFSSFSAAVKRLGGQTIEYQNPLQTSSTSKGETLEDMIRVFEAYSDLIIIRHHEVGIAQRAAAAASTAPIINAGDGVGEHPTQALLDLYTIYDEVGKLSNLTGVVAGDLLNGRTVHSLLRGLSLYKGNTLYLLSPKELRLSREEFEDFTNRGLKLVEIHSEREIPADCNFWYWTRVQKERFADETAYERVKNKFILTKRLLDEKGGKKTILMHPLPRVGEIETEVDSDPRAIYLPTQVRNGMYVRMALLSLILGKGT